MLKIKSYVKVKSLAEAYELNQKKTARIIGGMVWMKMGNRAVSTAIDLSGLGLDTIMENDEEFVIGCMTSLRDLETNEALDTYTHGAMKESLCHIVGVQFRNCATVGEVFMEDLDFLMFLPCSWEWIPGWNCTMVDVFR